jgi:hypothetical protein
MSCLRFNQEVTSACRNSQPGVATVYLANYDAIVSFTTNAAGTVLSGLTASGETGSSSKAFYQLAQNKNSAILLDTASINIANGTAVSKPKLTIKLQGLTEDIITVYKELLQASVVAVVKTIDAKYYAIGFNNGLDAITATLGTEAASDGFKGATFELEGTESTPFYLIDDTDGGLGSTFVTTYVI